MKNWTDVIVVFVFIVSIFSIFLLRESNVTANAKVVAPVQIVPSTKDMIVFPSKIYDLRYCSTQGTDGVSVGVVNVKGQGVVEQFSLQNTNTVTYACGKGIVVSKTLQ